MLFYITISIGTYEYMELNEPIRCHKTNRSGWDLILKRKLTFKNLSPSKMTATLHLKPLQIVKGCHSRKNYPFLVSSADSRSIFLNSRDVTEVTKRKRKYAIKNPSKKLHLHEKVHIVRSRHISESKTTFIVT